MNKKTYTVPMTTTFTVHMESHLLDGSVKIDGSKSAASDKGGWTKDQGSWGDIWDSDDDE